MTTRIHELCHDLAARRGGELALHFLDEEVALDYAALDLRARAQAALLQDRGLVGERVLVPCGTASSFVVSLLGCLYAGAVPVPCYPPDGRPETLAALAAIAADCAPAAILVEAARQARLRDWLAAEPALSNCTLLASGDGDATCWRPPLPSEIALLQYTSGSTARPKGVIVGQDNLADNLAHIRRRFAYEPEARIVSWLPLYHDMGLIGNLLQALFAGVPLFYLQPLRFLQKPRRWLEAIGRHRATHSGGPNFAYATCTRAIPESELEGLDLSSWRVAFNAAEPVRAQTLAEFAARFAAVGFRRAAFFPCYGLAEATLAVSGAPDPTLLAVDAVALSRGTVVPDPAGTTLVACGPLIEGHELCIVDPERECETDGIGELWLRGPSICRGTWTAGEGGFGARTADGRGPWLRTGDLGFVHQGQLYLTGRIAERLIVRGRNYAPADLEEAIQQRFPVLSAGAGALFGLPSEDGDRLVLVQEVANDQYRKLDHAQLQDEVRAFVAERFQLALRQLLLVRPGTVPRTTSGKLRRLACRQAYLDGAYAPVGASLHNALYGAAAPALDDLLDWLKAWAATRLNSRLMDARRAVPPYVVLDLGNRGLLGLEVPKQQGGLGLSQREIMRIMTQLGATDLNLASMVGVHVALGTRPLLRHGSETARAALLPGLASGRELGAFALTEPEAGANPRAIQARAVPCPGGWRLYGRKSWIGNGSWAGVLTVFAQTEDADGRPLGISAFVVRQGSPGLRQGPEALTMGMRGMVQNSLFLEGLTVAPEQLLGQLGGGLDVAQDAMNYGRLGIAATALGAMKQVARGMFRHAHRRQLGSFRALEHPVLAARLDRLSAWITAVEALVARLCAWLDAGQPVAPEAYAVCKTTAPEALWRAVDDYMQQLGGRGYIESNDIPRLLRDARLLRIFEGPTEALETWLGTRLLAESAELRALFDALGASAALKELEAHARIERSRYAALPEREQELALAAALGARLGPAVLAAVVAAAELDAGEREHALAWLAGSPPALRREALEARIARYARELGDLEQSLPGEDLETDPLLQERPAPTPPQLPLLAESAETRPVAKAAPAPAPADPAEAAIDALLTELLELPAEPQSRQRPLTALGLDSLAAARLVALLRERHGLDLSLAELFRGESAASLAQRLRAATPNARVAQLSPAPTERGRPFPLTEMQQAYWIGRGEAFQHGQVALHGYLELRADQLDHQRLADAWQSLIARHPMLRVVVTADGAQQVIEPVPSYQPRQVALVDEAALAALREELAHRAYPLEHWPQFELVVSTLADGRRHLHLSLDATFVDVWSFELLTRELAAAYRGETLPPPPELDFRDYVLGLAALADGPAARAAAAYWQARLPELAPAPALPTQATAGQRFARLAGRLDRADWQRLVVLAKDQGLTPAGLLLAAYAEVLALWSANPRFSLNVPLFNRLPLHPQVDQVVGNFSTFTLVEHRPGGRFADRARALQRQLLEGIEHQQLPGVVLLRELFKLRGNREQASMPVVFTSLPTGRGESGFDRLEECFGPVVQAITQTPQVWLDNQVAEDRAGLAIHWDHVEGLFPDGLVAAIFASYLELLKGLAAEPARLQLQQPVLAPAAQLAARRAHLRQVPVPDHGLIPLIAGHRGRDLAVVAPGRQLDGATLTAAANQLASRLRALGVRPGDRVALTLDKDWRQVVAVLAILRLGAAYVPLDADQPAERLAWMLRDCGARVGLGPKPAACPAEPSTWLMPEAPAAAAMPEWDLSDADLPAYVIYTSGSTGRPKGVVVGQRAVVNLVRQTNLHFAVEATDRALALTPLHHDLSVYDLFGPLAAGGAVVLPDPEHRRDPHHQARLIADWNVTLWNSVPAAIQPLLTLERLPNSLRLIILGGDWIPLSLVEHLRRRLPAAQLLGIGGPTETTVWNIWYPIQALEPHWRSVPYGRPMPNSATLVLDSDLRERPDWVPGELYCSGAGLAQGYLGAPARTAQAFLPGPDGTRLYRTGDLGRVWPDGTIEFLGRVDHQVKLNGHRIECGEIEHCLRRHPDVAEAFVLPLTQDGATRLVACVLPRAASADGLLQDKAARALFKLSQPGRRASRPGAARIPLAGATDETTWLRRQSHRDFLSEPLAQQALAELLAALRAHRRVDLPLAKFRYPSGGALYPVQTWIAVRAGRVAGLAEGLYYHDPYDHCLEQVSAGPLDGRGDHWATNQAIWDGAAFTLFLVGRTAAVAPLYGPLARDFCLLEAGHMAQLLAERAPDHGIGLCPLGHMAWSGLPAAFELPADAPFLALLGGPIAPEQQQRWSSEPAGRPADPTEDLAAYCRSHLPRPMRPSQFLTLEQLPLTANGKVDRAALARLASARLSETRPVAAAPETPLERDLAELWRELLPNLALGRHDDVFERGADSLSATRFIALLRQRRQLELPLKALFEHPTLASLALHISALSQFEGYQPPSTSLGEDEEEGLF